MKVTSQQKFDLAFENQKLKEEIAHLNEKIESLRNYIDKR